MLLKMKYDIPCCRDVYYAAYRPVLLAAEQEEGLRLRVVDVAVRQCYRFNCPNCGSRLEADCGDLVDIGGKTSRFWCPVCRKERYVPWSALRKRVVYEDKSAE